MPLLIVKLSEAICLRLSGWVARCFAGSRAGGGPTGWLAGWLVGLNEPLNVMRSEEASNPIINLDFRLGSDTYRRETNCMILTKSSRRQRPWDKRPHFETRSPHERTCAREQAQNIYIASFDANNNKKNGARSSIPQFFPRSSFQAGKAATDTV